jgi:hypothetical protein
MICTQKELEHAQRWRTKHPNERKIACKKWRNANREHWNMTRREWRNKNIIHALHSAAKSRSKQRGVEFTIDVADIPPMGTHCPLLGYPFDSLEIRGGPNSVSLDRIDPTKGYIKGNIWIVGRRANMIKNDGTAEEHEKIARAMRTVEATRVR